MTRKYEVAWRIEVDADSWGEAAARVWATMRKGEKISLEVKVAGGRAAVEVRLYDQVCTHCAEKIEIMSDPWEADSGAFVWVLAEDGGTTHCPESAEGEHEPNWAGQLVPNG